MQRQLCTDGMLEEIEFGPYAAQLCAGLARSMTDGEERVAILTSSSGGKIKSGAGGLDAPVVDAAIVFRFGVDRRR